MPKKITLEKLASSIEHLAIITNNGFEEVNSKMVTKEEFAEEIKLIHGKLDVIELEILDIKKKIDNVIYRHEFELLKEKVSHIEKVLAELKKK